MRETMNSIKGNVGYRKMTENDILQEIISLRIAENNEDD
jgi:hypothetical protein